MTIILRLDFTALSETGQVSFHLAVYEPVSQQFWNVSSSITYRFAANGKMKQLGLDLILDVNRIKRIRQSVCVQTVVGWWCAGLCPAKWLDALMDRCLWNHIQCPEACCLILPTKSKFDWFISHCFTDLIQKWQIIAIINSSNSVVVFEKHAKGMKDNLSVIETFPTPILKKLGCSVKCFKTKCRHKETPSRNVSSRQKTHSKMDWAKVNTYGTL